MNPTSVDIKDMLVAESSLGLTFATNLFVGMEPSIPDNCVTIFDTPGRPPQLTLDNSTYDYPSVQIRIRNRNYTVGWSLANNIKVLLHGKEHETWNGTLYTVLKCTNDPFLLDWDENNKRARFVVNFDVQRR